MTDEKRLWYCKNKLIKRNEEVIRGNFAKENSKHIAKSKQRCYNEINKKLQLDEIR